MTRQYTQLIALMENYDFYQQNIGRAENADGTLQKQADIYAESWEASRDRVTASLEEIYQKLLDDGFFIKMLDTLSKVIDGISDIIDNMGGLQGVLSSAGLILTNIFSSQMASAIDKFVFNIRNIAVETGHAFGIFKQFQTEEEKIRVGMGSLGSEIEQAYSNLYDPKGENGFGVLAKQVYDLQDEYNKNSANMSEEQKAYYQQRIKNSEQLFNTLVKQSDVYEQIAEKQKQEEDHLQKVIGAEQERLKTEEDRLKVEEKNNNIQTTKINSDLTENEDDLNEAGSDIINNFDSTNEEHIKQLKNAANETALWDDASMQAWSKQVLALVEKNKSLKEQKKLHEENTEKIKEQTKKLEEQKDTFQKIKDLQSGEDARIQKLKSSYQAQGALTAIKGDLSDGIADEQAAKKTADSLKNVIEILPNNSEIKKQVQKMFNVLETEINTQHDKIDLSTVMIDGQSLSQRLAEVIGTLEEDSSSIYDSLVKDFQASGMSFEAYGKALQDAGLKIEPFKQALEKAGVSVKNLSDEMKKGSAHTFDLGKSLTGATQLIMSFNTIVNTGQGTIKTLGDSSKTTSEQIGSVSQGLLTLIPVIVSVGNAIKAGIGPVGWVIAAIGGVLTLVQVLSQFDWRSKAEKELDALRKDTEQLEQTIESTRAKAEELKSAFDGYIEVENVLEKCTKGTQEWYDALNDVQTNVSKLIKDYPELIKQGAIYFDSESGIYRVDEKKYKGVINTITSGADALERGKALNYNRQTALEYDDARDNFIDNRLNGLTAVADDNLYWTEEQRTRIENIFDSGDLDIYTQISNAIITGEAEALKQALDQIDSGLYDEMFQFARENSGATEDEIYSMIASKFAINQEVLDEFAQATDRFDAAVTSNNIESGIYGSNILRAQGYSSEDITLLNDNNNYIGANYNQLSGELENDIKEKIKSGNEYGKTSKEAQDYVDLISDDIEGTNAKIKKIDNDGKITIEYIGEDNQKHTKVDNGYVNYLVGSQIDEEYAKRAGTQIQTMKTANELGQGLGSFLVNGDASDINGDTRKILENALAPGNYENYNQLLKDIGFNIDNNEIDLTDEYNIELANSLGYDSVGAFVNGFADNVRNALANNDIGGEIAEGTVQSVENSLNNMNTGFSANELAKMTDLSNEAFAIAGKEGLTKLKNAFDEADNIDVTEFAESLSRIDQYDTFEDFLDSINEAGKDVSQYDTDAMREYFNTIKKNQITKQDVATTKEAYAAVHKVIDKLEEGSTIDAESYEELSKSVDGLSEYFIEMADGTHKLVGDAAKFYKMVHDQEIQDWSDKIDANLTEKQQLADAKNFVDNSNRYEANNSVGGADVDEELKLQLELIKQYSEDDNDILNAQQLLTQKEFTINDIEQITAMYDKLALSTEKIEWKQQQLEKENEQLALSIITSSATVDEYNKNLEKYGDYLAEDISLGDLYSQQLKNEQTNINGTINALKQHNDLTSQQSYLLDQLEEQYPALNAIRDRSSSEYLAALREINEQLEDEKIRVDAQRLNQLIEVDIEANSDKFKEQMDEICDAAYEVLVDVKADIQSDFDNIIGEIEDASTMAAKIGENFIVSAQDIEELNDTFPGILTNMTLLKDGTAKLNKDAVQSAMAAAGEIVNADSQKTVEILKNQQEELEIKQQSALDAAKIAREAADGEKLTDKQKAKLKEDLSNLSVEQKQEESEQNKSEIVAEAQTGVNAANAQASAFEEAYRKMTKDSATWAEAAKQNYKVATTGQGTPKYTFETKGFDSSQFTPESVANTRTLSLTSAEEVLNQNDYETVAIYFEELADSYGQAINNTQGKIGEILARNNALGKTLGNVAVGKGASGKSSSSKRSAEKERYHQVNKEREAIELQKSLNSAYQKQTFGQDQINLIKAEEELIDQQIENTKKHLQEAYNYLATDISALMSKGYGFTLDPETGVINNYDAIVDHYRQLFLSGSLSEEAWQEFQKVTKQYEETLKETQDWELKLEEDTIAKHEAKIKEITTEVELKISINEDGLKYLDFLMTMIEDDAFNAAQNIALLGQSLELNMKNIDTYKNGIKEVLGSNGADQATIDKILSGNYSNDDLLKLGMSDDDVDKIRDYANNIRELTIDIHQYWNQVYDNMSNDLDEYVDGIDRATKKIEHNMKTADWLKDIVKLTGQTYADVTNATLDALDQATVQMSQKTLDTLVLEQATINDKLEELRAENRDAMTEEQRKAYDKEVEYFEDQLMSATEAVQNAHKQTLEAINTAFEESMHRAIEAFQNSLNGENRLDILADSYDKYLDLRDQYLATYEKEYELSKLNRELQNKIDNTSNLKAKQQLLDMQREITALQESGAQMSKYDLEYLQKKIELQEAQLALEEARNAKSNVALRRNADGGFSYVYTANQEDVANAEQNYEDKLYEMQKLNEQYLDDLQNNIYELEQAFGNELEALKLQDLSDDLYAQEMQRLLDYYGPKLGIYLTQLDNVCDNTGKTFEDTFVGQNSPVQTSQEYLENFMNQAGILYDESADRIKLWSDSVHNAYASVNLDSQNLNNNIQEQFIGEGEDDPNSLVGMSKLAADSAEDLSETYKKAFEDSLSAVKTFQEQYGELIQNVIDQNKAYIGNLNNVIATLAALERQHKATKDAADSGNAGNYIGSASQGDSGGQGIQTQTPLQGTAKPQVAAKDWQVILKDTGTVLASNKTEASAQAWIDNHSIKYSSAYKDSTKHIWYVRKVIPTSINNSSLAGKTTGRVDALFATGGYTGDWGDNGTDLSAGRLAVLHSKELVLNRDDTVNMLSAVDIVRQISKVIDLNAMAASQSFITSAIGAASTDNVLKQQVTITAEFPNVVNHSEIEEAFENIVDLASQYANRKYR